MLTVAECRQYLDEETNASSTDAEVLRARDELQKLADILIADVMSKQKKKDDLQE